MTNAATPRELLIVTVARLLDGIRHVAVGASSPIPAAGAMLLRAQKEEAGERPVRISILGSVKHNFFTNGSVELFDCAGQGRIDAFFLGGGQIDGQGNVNLVGTGSYPRSQVRWPGSFGSAYLYFVVPRVILFREEHTRRVFVERVDFVSAPGTSVSGTYRTGGPHALLTGRGLFSFDRMRGVSGSKPFILATALLRSSKKPASRSLTTPSRRRPHRHRTRSSPSCEAACSTNCKRAIQTSRGNCAARSPAHKGSTLAVIAAA